MTKATRNLTVQALGCIALSFIGSVASSASPSVRATVRAGQSDSIRLEPGHPISRAIAAGETHAYRISLRANQALHLVATQLGADIILTLRGTGGKPIVEMDSPTGGGGAESIWFVAPTSGDFQVEVRTFEAAAGRYELSVQTLREATADDVKRAQTQALLLEAGRLGVQRTPEAQQVAIAKLKEAVALARSLNERDMVTLSMTYLTELDIGAGLEILALPSLPGKVPVYYSPGYEARASTLRDRLAKAVDFFEQGLGVTPKIYLAILARDHWSNVVFSGAPYGMPNSFNSLSGSGLVCIAATYEAFDEMGRSIKADLPDAALKAIESTGLSFEEGMRELGDSIIYHELGHTYTAAYGMRIQSPWVNEFLANYLGFAYTEEQPGNPKLEKFQEIMSAESVKGPRPKHTSLEDFERLYMGVGFQNYGWYQEQISRRAKQVYKTKKLDFLTEVKAAFPPNENGPIPVGVSLERLEKISPGFLDWARQLAGGAQ